MSDDPGFPDDELVGATLARLRRERGLTGAQLAARVRMSQPKISRIERGKGVVDPADVRAIARALGARDDEVARLVELAERPHDRMTDWRSTADNLASRQTTVAGWESTAAVIREFQPAVVPGLLQSSGYAEATLTGFQQLVLGGSNAESIIRAAVTERLRRQQILADSSKSFSFLITEQVLRNEICPPAEMLAQIGRIRDAATRWPNVTVGVIPDGIRLALPPLHGFWVQDDSKVILDVFNTGILTRGPKDVAVYNRAFEIFAASAVAPGPLLDKYEAYYIGRLQAHRPA
ncbi:helix-turn-helix transcriptional regulator [Actinoplanes sp. NPDC051411]|uniref:helix-turn-helix domain-containing protein n=1 Tax=Actinoplanes sp. NPDC051411 TaxID=3155522 RepID=UPI00342A4CE0